MLANLKPAKLCEVEPNGMMLAVGNCKNTMTDLKLDNEEWFYPTN